MYRSRSLQGQTADCGSAMRRVSVESFVTFFGLMGAAVWATASLIDLRYSKNSSIWILNNRLFLAARTSLHWGSIRADMTFAACLLSRSLLGVKRTSLVAAHMSAFDPKRTFRSIRYHQIISGKVAALGRRKAAALVVAPDAAAGAALVAAADVAARPAAGAALVVAAD